LVETEDVEETPVEVPQLIVLGDQDAEVCSEDGTCA
jgi:hypothetical protein